MTGPVHGFGRLHIIKYQLKNKPQIEHNPYQNCNSFFFSPGNGKTDPKLI